MNTIQLINSKRTFYKYFLIFILINTAVLKIAKAQQFAFSLESMPTVKNEINSNSFIYKTPFMGGLKAPMLSNLKLNGDPMMDLVVFDRATAKVYTYLAVENPVGQWDWQYAPEYEAVFPKMKNWLLIRDVDGDGQLDLFTSEFARAGMRIFRNSGRDNSGKPSFSLLDPYVQTTLLAGSPAPYYANSTDVPFVGDIDGDGDMDIINQEFTGFGFELHLNLSVDSSGVPGIRYRKISNCFGGVSATSTCGTYSFNPCLGIPIEEPYSGGRVMHAGATIQVLDLNDDQKKDIILGDISCNRAYSLMNVTTRDTSIGFAYSTVDRTYPGDTTRPHLGTFINANLVDINFDGKEDLVFSNNDVATDPLADANKFYFVPWHRNLNTRAPFFTLNQTNYLADNSLDLGSYSRPFAFDVDGDGDDDLLVTTEGKTIRGRTFSAIYLYRNSGTDTLSLVDTNYLRTQTQNWRDVKLQLADINGDRRPDLIVHRRQSFDYITEVYRNQTGNLSNAFNYSRPITISGLSVSPFDSYAFADLNRDGFEDLLVGRFFGRVDYYRNNADSSFSFTLVQEGFGNLNFPDSRLQELSVAIKDLNRDSTNLPELIVGNSEGQLFIYPNVSENDAQRELVVDSLFFRRSLNDVPAKGVFPRYLTPTIGDFGGDSLPDIVLGNIGGGLNMLINQQRNPFVPVSTSQPISSLWSVFPNPTNGQLTLSGATIGEQYFVYNLSGKKALSGRIASSKEVISLAHLPAGTYFLRCGKFLSKVSRK